MELSLWMWKLPMHAVNHLQSYKIYLKINVENIEKVFFDKRVFCLTVKDYNQKSLKKYSNTLNVKKHIESKDWK